MSNKVKSEAVVYFERINRLSHDPPAILWTSTIFLLHFLLISRIYKKSTDMCFYLPSHAHLLVAWALGMKTFLSRQMFPEISSVVVFVFWASQPRCPFFFCYSRFFSRSCWSLSPFSCICFKNVSSSFSSSSVSVSTSAPEMGPKARTQRFPRVIDLDGDGVDAEWFFFVDELVLFFSIAYLI